MKSIASTLIHELGIKGAHKYALRIAAAYGPLSSEYAAAALEIEGRAGFNRGMCEVCGIYPGDPKVCAGCEAYAEHTAVH